MTHIHLLNIYAICKLVCFFVLDYLKVQSSLNSEVVRTKDEVSVSSEESDAPLTSLALNCSIVNLKGELPSEPVVVDKEKLVACGKQNSTNSSNRNASSDSHLLTTIIAITPTYRRLTQKLDLVSLCQTIMHIRGLLWLVIEDSKLKSSLVQRVLSRCSVNSVHLNVVTTKQTKKAVQRGVEQRNTGLDWARKYCKENCDNICNGVIYFMDDDNKYDLRVFEEVSWECRTTESIQPCL